MLRHPGIFECGNYRSISRVAHAGKIFLKIVSYEAHQLPEKHCGFRTHHSTMDIMFMVSIEDQPL